MAIDVEQLYTVKEVAQALRRSEDTVRRLFVNEPGVLKRQNPKSRFKRSYVTLLIPDPVFRRVWNRMKAA